RFAVGVVIGRRAPFGGGPGVVDWSRARPCRRARTKDWISYLRSRFLAWDSRDAAGYGRGRLKSAGDRRRAGSDAAPGGRVDPPCDRPPALYAQGGRRGIVRTVRSYLLFFPETNAPKARAIAPNTSPSIVTAHGRRSDVPAGSGIMSRPYQHDGRPRRTRRNDG